MKKVPQFTDTKDFYDLREMFEKEYKHMRLDREDPNLQRLEIFYQDGAVNDLFNGFMKGYAYCKYLAVRGHFDS